MPPKQRKIAIMGYRSVGKLIRKNILPIKTYEIEVQFLNNIHIYSR